jgi:SSS family solute:Na+ symporter
MLIDNIIVLTYLLSILTIGIYQRSRSSSFKGFARISDKFKTSRLILVATIFASSVGGGTTFGLSEKAFLGNLSHSYGLLLAIPVDLLIATYLVPRIIAQHYGKESIGDIMSVHYGACGRTLAGFSAIFVSVGLIAAQISVSGRIFEYILQIDYVKGVIFSYSIVVIYTTIGGLRSILFTNQLQFFAMILAIPTISIFGIHQLGFDNFLSNIPPEKVGFNSNNQLFFDTISAMLGFMTMNLFPTFFVCFYLR